MTYLDPEQTQHHPNWGQWAIRLAGGLAIGAVAWVAFTFGNADGTGRPNIVPEPAATTQAAQ